MDYDEIIARLEELRGVMELYNGKMYESSDEAKVNRPDFSGDRLT